jgi:hypothetical protein
MPILARRSRLRRQSAHSHNFAESIDKDCELRAKTDFLDAILNPIAITWNASAIESHQCGGHTRSIPISPPRLRITRFWYGARSRSNHSHWKPRVSRWGRSDTVVLRFSRSLNAPLSCLGIGCALRLVQQTLA